MEYRAPDAEAASPDQRRCRRAPRADARRGHRDGARHSHVPGGDRLSADRRRRTPYRAPAVGRPRPPRRADHRDERPRSPAEDARRADRRHRLRLLHRRGREVRDDDERLFLQARDRVDLPRVRGDRARAALRAVAAALAQRRARQRARHDRGHPQQRPERVRAVPHPRDARRLGAADADRRGAAGRGCGVHDGSRFTEPV